MSPSAAELAEGAPGLVNTQELCCGFICLFQAQLVPWPASYHKSFLTAEGSKSQRLHSLWLKHCWGFRIAPLLAEVPFRRLYHTTRLFWQSNFKKLLLLQVTHSCFLHCDCTHRKHCRMDKSEEEGREHCQSGTTERKNQTDALLHCISESLCKDKLSFSRGKNRLGPIRS